MGVSLRCNMLPSNDPGLSASTSTDLYMRPSARLRTELIRISRSRSPISQARAEDRQFCALRAAPSSRSASGSLCVSVVSSKADEIEPGCFQIGAGLRDGRQKARLLMSSPTAPGRSGSPPSPAQTFRQGKHAARPQRAERFTITARLVGDVHDDVLRIGPGRCWCPAPAGRSGAALDDRDPVVMPQASLAPAPPRRIPGSGRRR